MYTIIDNCTGCTACEKRCPTSAIHGVKKEMFYIDAELCIDCGACGVVCPDDTILDSYGRLCEQIKGADRPKAFVELEKCTGCVYCVNSCPFDVITMEVAPPVLQGLGGISERIAVVETKRCTSDLLNRFINMRRSAPATCSAASRVKPFANTANRSSPRCSFASNSRHDASKTARILR